MHFSLHNKNKSNAKPSIIFLLLVPLLLLPLTPVATLLKIRIDPILLSRPIFNPLRAMDPRNVSPMDGTSIICTRVLAAEVPVRGEDGLGHVLPVVVDCLGCWVGVGALEVWVVFPDCAMDVEVFGSDLLLCEG